MSLLDSVLGAVTNAGSNTGQSPLMGLVLGLLSDNKLGGLSGLMEKFKVNGMGDQVASWIGSGSNLPVSSAQVEQVLGAQQVQQLATKSGMAPADVLTQLTQLLPDVVNKLTPGGSMPSGGMLDQGIGLLKGKLLG